LRYFFRRYDPPFTRVLLVESGSRSVFDRVVTRLYQTHGETMELDLVTCHAGTPAGFRGRVYRVQDHSTPAARSQLYAELAERGYTVTGILCSSEPIMTKWKWMLAARLPAKVLVINENADSLWLDGANWRSIARMGRIRLGLTGSAAGPTLLRVFVWPFSLAYLLLFAAVVHTKRRIRTS
jgi:hypothetical protein